jgi:hypothetical protein
VRVVRTRLGLDVFCDQGKQSHFQRALVQLGAVADAELVERVEQRLQRDPLGVEQKLLLGFQDAHLGEHAALVRQRRRVGALSGRERGDVVRQHRVEKRGGVRPAERELAAL